MYLMHLNTPRIWKICMYKIKQVIESHSHECYIKIKLCIEYCKFLLTLTYFTISNNDI